MARPGSPGRTCPARKTITLSSHSVRIISPKRRARTIVTCRLPLMRLVLFPLMRLVLFRVCSACQANRVFGVQATNRTAPPLSLSHRYGAGPQRGRRRPCHDCQCRHPPRHRCAPLGIDTYRQPHAAVNRAREPGLPTHHLRTEPGRTRGVASQAQAPISEKLARRTCASSPMSPPPFRLTRCITGGGWPRASRRASCCEPRSTSTPVRSTAGAPDSLR